MSGNEIERERSVGVGELAAASDHYRSGCADDRGWRKALRFSALRLLHRSPHRISQCKKFIFGGYRRGMTSHPGVADDNDAKDRQAMTGGFYNIPARIAVVIGKATLPFRTGRFWIAIYLGLGLLFAGIVYGETVRYQDCRVFTYIFLGRANGAAEGIIVTTLFWPAILIAGLTATCR